MGLIENSSFYHIKKKNWYGLRDLSSLTRDQICVLNSEKHRVLTTGPLGNSQKILYKKLFIFWMC